MQINLKPIDVVTALTNHLRTTGIQTDGQTISFAFKNRRKGDPGIHAVVTIDSVAEAPVEAVTTVADVPTVVEPANQPQAPVAAAPASESLFD